MKTSFPVKTHYINGKSKAAPQLLAKQLGQLLSSLAAPEIPPVFICIGSDRVTGDSLGPLIGTILRGSSQFPYPVFGTLHRPIHALNLNDSVQEIRRRYPHSPFVAIDASLGTKRHQNYITIAPGSLTPGSGVDKTLMEVGDIAITGIINTCGEFSQMILQTTRLCVVMELASAISQGILLACPDVPQAESAATKFAQTGRFD